ncbi:hypothetical protein CONPUDRAFT_82459 [Coniophora puteana RWD-64-598 SS2]|uniref:Uncharacterized protein n=1 Tax=Coniophora puteana (strain RWD-64-598) TaxID=741705 RepID=A0A5M3MQY9_CONPW|nr:uncharacterized protein CONPUDRAFT_82459 [Coniophora puteana RWD-64-598 SS2]EIW81592.1 hypothetical protein CONPUDRAFT_82459 [Coniophora puteana RWD-64-598 SS2]
MSSRSPSPSSTIARAPTEADAYSIAESTAALIPAGSKYDETAKTTATANATATAAVSSSTTRRQAAPTQEKDWSAALATLSGTYGYGGHIAPPVEKKEPKIRGDGKAKAEHASKGLRERIVRKLKGATSAPVTPSPSVLSFASLASTASAGVAANEKKGKGKEKGNKGVAEDPETQGGVGGATVKEDAGGSGSRRSDL